jgi:Isoprenylcysteine carboxyl methyltransferase (ICMT) family
VLAVLGRIWTTLFIAGRKDVELVTTGPYAACRHPLYACSLAAAAGLGLAAQSIVLAAALPALLAIAFVFSIDAEERLLAAAHGDRWTRYAAQVPRLWPEWRRLEWPARIEVDVAVYRKAFIDAASFLGLLLIMQALAALRGLDWWPALFALP